MKKTMSTVLSLETEKNLAALCNLTGCDAAEFVEKAVRKALQPFCNENGIIEGRPGIFLDGSSEYAIQAALNEGREPVIERIPVIVLYAVEHFEQPYYSCIRIMDNGESLLMRIPQNQVEVQY